MTRAKNLTLKEHLEIFHGISGKKDKVLEAVMNELGRSMTIHQRIEEMVTPY